MPIRVGLLGGSFDPPHISHLLLAIAALEVGGLDEVWWIPLFHHAFGVKEPAPFEDRAEMVRDLVGPYAPRMRVLDIEARLGGTSFTIDTVRDLRARHPEATMRLVLGEDLLAELPRWKESAALVALAPPLVVGRERAPATGPLPEGATRLPIVLPEVSSTAARAALQRGESPEAWVPRRVLDYIRSRGLYRADPGEGGIDGGGSGGGRA